MKFKTLSAVLVFSISLPALGMEGVERVPEPTRLKHIIDCPLQDLRHPENYNKLEENKTFAVKDGKSYFTVTKVAPYKSHWLWGWAGTQAQYKYFERPRYFNPTFFPFPLVTESGYATHKKRENLDLGITIRTIQYPSKYGLMAIGGASCVALGCMAYMNGLFSRN